MSTYTEEEVQTLRDAVNSWRGMYQKTKSELESVKCQLASVQVLGSSPEARSLNIDYQRLKMFLEVCLEEQATFTARHAQQAFRYCPMTFPRFLRSLEEDWVFKRTVEMETGFMLEVKRMSNSGVVMVTGRCGK